LTVLGYGLGAISKPLFAVALSVHWVFAARFMDRIGKGIRAAPRDALIADLAPPEIRGAAYGLRQSLDTVGAFIGPLLAVGLMLLWSDDFRTVFWFAVVPATLAVLILIFGVHEPGAARRGRPPVSPVRWQTLGSLGGRYWWIVAAGGIFALARFSEAFLILRAGQTGLANALAPLVLVVMNVVFAVSAYPVGRLADRLPHRSLLVAGLGVLIVADIVLALAPGLGVVAAGVVLWGLHMGMTQGLLATMVAGAAPAHLRGTAFGLFNLVGGVATLLASVLAGVLWDQLGAAATFGAGAAFAALAFAVVMIGPRSGVPPASSRS